MKSLEKSQDRIQQICAELRKDTLEPAKNEADRIIAEAHNRGREIIVGAEKEADKLKESAKCAIEQEHNVFQSSLSQGIKQGLESLRQEIEHKLFNEQLSAAVNQGTADPQIIAKLINSIVAAIDKEGISADLSAIVPKTVSAASVNSLLIEGVLKKLKEKGVQIGSFEGGAKIQLHDKQLTIDISDGALKELLAGYIRKDFRKIIFAT